MTTIYWTCIDCPLIGDMDGTAEKHTRATGHTTLTGTDPAALARMRDTEAHLRAARAALAACREVREARA